MSREAALAAAESWISDGGFFDELARRVAVRTESQKPESLPELHRYLDTEMQPALPAPSTRTRSVSDPCCSPPGMKATLCRPSSAMAMAT